VHISLAVLCCELLSLQSCIVTSCQFLLCGLCNLLQLVSVCCFICIKTVSWPNYIAVITASCKLHFWHTCVSVYIFIISRPGSSVDVLNQGQCHTNVSECIAGGPPWTDKTVSLYSGVEQDNCFHIFLVVEKLL